MKYLFSRRQRRRFFIGRKRLRFVLKRSQSGLTLVEALVVIVIAGILMSIMGPSWVGLQTNNSLTAAQDQVFQAIRQTQLQAIHAHQTRQVGFRETASQIEWAIYPAGLSSASAIWQPMLSNVRIAIDQTTLRRKDGAYFVEFNQQGNVTPPFGRLSLMSNKGGSKRHCVIVSTLLGVLRKATNSACY